MSDELRVTSDERESPRPWRLGDETTHPNFVEDANAAGSPASPANPTAEAIVRRLPDKPLLNAREVADALNLSDTRLVANAVDTGTIRAVKVGKRYRISRDEAARWIRTLEAAR